MANTKINMVGSLMASEFPEAIRLMRARHKLAKFSGVHETMRLKKFD